MRNARTRLKELFSGGNGVFFIAEAGCNYEGDITKAAEMVQVAAQAGAAAIKFQTFNPERLVTKDAPKFWNIPGCPGATQFEEFAQTPQLAKDQYRTLKKIAANEGILLFSTPSDEESVDLLEAVGVPLYKISSMDLTHHPLLRYVAQKGKPVILSTGASTLGEIREAVSIIEAEGNRQIGILHCITSYPTKPKDVNLNMMKTLMEEFPEYPVGYSDHTVMPTSSSVILAAVALGARIIEKHFTFDKSRPGYDHMISVNYRDLTALLRDITFTQGLLGARERIPLKVEEQARILARRSLVAKTRIPQGTQITAGMLEIKRPGTGISPKFLQEVIGRITIKDIPGDQVITWEEISGAPARTGGKK